MRKAYFPVVLAVFLSACGLHKGPPEQVTVSNIGQVLMHEPDSFTFLVNFDDGKIGQLEMRVDTQESYYSQGVKMMRDLSPTQSIWITYVCGKYKGDCRSLPQEFSRWTFRAHDLTIHLHSAEEINGAGWHHGKHGSGQTEVLK